MPTHSLSAHLLSHLKVWDPLRCRIHYQTLDQLGAQSIRSVSLNDKGDGIGYGPASYGATYTYPYGDGARCGDQQGGGWGAGNNRQDGISY